MSTIGEKIKTLRKKTGMTQEALAKKLDVIQQQIHRWESGGRNPSLKTLTKLSKIFNVSLDTLILDGKEIKNLKIKDENILEKIKKLEHYGSGCSLRFGRLLPPGLPDILILKLQGLRFLQTGKELSGCSARLLQVSFPWPAGSWLQTGLWSGCSFFKSPFSSK